MPPGNKRLIGWWVLRVSAISVTDVANLRRLFSDSVAFIYCSHCNSGLIKQCLEGLPSSFWIQRWEAEVGLPSPGWEAPGGLRMEPRQDRDLSVHNVNQCLQNILVLRKPQKYMWEGFRSSKMIEMMLVTLRNKWSLLGKPWNVSKMQREGPRSFPGLFWPLGEASLKPGLTVSTSQLATFPLVWFTQFWSAHYCSQKPPHESQCSTKVCVQTSWWDGCEGNKKGETLWDFQEIVEERKIVYVSV